MSGEEKLLNATASVSLVQHVLKNTGTLKAGPCQWGEEC